MARVARAAWVGAVVAVPILATGTAVAVSGSFRVAGPAPAVVAVNSGSGDGLSAESLRGNAIAAHARGSGREVGVYGVTQAPDGAGVRGDNRGHGSGPGVLGVGPLVGVLGRGRVSGVVGNSGGRPGDGTFGVTSYQDAYLGGHLVAANDNFVGRCEVPAGATTGSCTFTDPFGGADPIVVLTPRGDPGGYSWVSGVSRKGFTINVSRTPGGGPVSFNYIVVGQVGLVGNPGG